MGDDCAAIAEVLRRGAVVHALLVPRGEGGRRFAYEQRQLVHAGRPYLYVRWSSDAYSEEHLQCTAAGCAAERGGAGGGERCYLTCVSDPRAKKKMCGACAVQ